VKLLLIFLILVLPACTSLPRVETVKVAVPVRCEIVPIEKPILYFEQAKPEDSLYDKVKLLLAERIERIAYEKNLEAGLMACVK